MRKFYEVLRFRHLQCIRFVNKATEEAQDIENIGSTEHLLLQRDSNVLDVQKIFGGLCDRASFEL